MDKKKIYSLWFLAPALTIFLVFFIIPMVISLFFSLTVWDFEKFTFVGLDNFKMFFSERTLNIGIINTLIYAALTSGLKVVLAFLIAVFLTSAIRTKNIIRLMVFFPNLVSTIAVGITFTAFMHPTKGVFNKFIEFFGGTGIDWLGNADLALYSVIGTDVWKGLSIATMIYIAGISSIDKTYYEAAAIDVYKRQTLEWQHKKPDLRKREFRGYRGKHVCIEIESSEDKVSLSDEVDRHFVLYDSYMPWALNQEEFDRQWESFEDLPEGEKRVTKEKSWESIFTVAPPSHNEWNQTGRYIQATFWKLNLDQVRSCLLYTSCL